MKETEDDTHRWKGIGKINIVLELEESILLKLPYHPRQSKDSMQSLSNYQWQFLQN